MNMSKLEELINKRADIDRTIESEIAKALNSRNRKHSWREIAGACGVSRAHLHAIARGQSAGAPEVQLRIVRALAELN